MDRVAIDFGPVQIYWYSIFIFLGILAACSVIFKEAKKQNISEDFLVNLVFGTIIVGILGARLYYVIFNLAYYVRRPLEIIAIWNGGLAIHGGIILGALYIIYYCRKHKVLTLKILDILVVGLIIGQAIGRWGNFFNSEAYGAITTIDALQKQMIPDFIIKGMFINGFYRQPTFFYESVWCFAGFLSLLIIRKYKYLKRGQLTGYYLIWYGIGRFMIESMRTDSLMLGNLKIAQIVSLAFIALGVILFFWNLFSRKEEATRLYSYEGPKEGESAIKYYHKRGDHYV